MANLLRLTSAIALVAGALWMASGESGRRPSPVPVPDVGDDLGTADPLRMAFTGPDAREDAFYLASVFAAAAERVEQDGLQPQPLITRRIQIETLVTRLGQAAVMGRTQGKYPALPEVIARVFAEHFPSEQGQLSAADRAAAVRLLRGLASGCRKAVSS